MHWAAEAERVSASDSSGDYSSLVADLTMQSLASTATTGGGGGSFTAANVRQLQDFTAMQELDSPGLPLEFGGGRGGSASESLQLPVRGCSALPVTPASGSSGLSAREALEASR